MKSLLASDVSQQQSPWKKITPTDSQGKRQLPKTGEKRGKEREEGETQLMLTLDRSFQLHLVYVKSASEEEEEKTNEWGSSFQQLI